jgi:hypothetical protein
MARPGWIRWLDRKGEAHPGVFWSCLVLGIILVTHFGNKASWASSVAEGVIFATLILLIKM